MSESVSWERWDSLRTAETPDPVEILKAVASFQRYFKAVERQAIDAARAEGRSWQEIAAALGHDKRDLFRRAGVTWDDANREPWISSVNQARDARAEVGLDPFWDQSPVSSPRT